MAEPTVSHDTALALATAIRTCPPESFHAVMRALGVASRESAILKVNSNAKAAAAVEALLLKGKTDAV